MKDLYRKLGIKPGASVEEITEAVNLKPDLAAQASILLDAHKRARYDRAHAALSAIGMLRHRLGLESGSAEFALRHADFAVGSAGDSRRQEAVVPPPEKSDLAGKPSPKSSAPKASNRLLIIVVGIVIVVLLVLVLLNFGSG